MVPLLAVGAVAVIQQRKRPCDRLKRSRLVVCRSSQRSDSATSGTSVGNATPSKQVAPGSDISDGNLYKFGEWCALVVNLERRSDRMQKLEQVLHAANSPLWNRMERIDAIDGRTLSFDDVDMEQFVEFSTLARAKRAKRLGLYTVIHDDKNILVNFDDHLTEGAVACAMSHHKALERVATHPTAQWGLILEDDVSKVVPDVEAALARLLAKLPEDWNAVFVGYHHDDGKPHPAAMEPEADPSIVDVPLFPVYDHCWGLFAWMVRKEAAQSLLDNLFPISTQVDCAISSWLVRNRGQVFKVPPEELLFYSSCSEEAQDSDIQTMTSEEGVVQMYGSMDEYNALQSQSRPSTFEELMEDMYGSDWEQYESEDELNSINEP